MCAAKDKDDTHKGLDVPNRCQCNAWYEVLLKSYVRNLNFYCKVDIFCRV